MIPFKALHTCSKDDENELVSLRDFMFNYCTKRKSLFIKKKSPSIKVYFSDVRKISSLFLRIHKSFYLKYGGEQLRLRNACDHLLTIQHPVNLAPFTFNSTAYMVFSANMIKVFSAKTRLAAPPEMMILPKMVP